MVRGRGKVGVTVAEGEKYIFGKFLLGQNVGSKSWYDLLARVFHGKTLKITTQVRQCFITVEATRMPYLQLRWTTCKLLDKVTTAKERTTQTSSTRIFLKTRDVPDPWIKLK